MCPEGSEDAILPDCLFSHQILKHTLAHAVTTLDCRWSSRTLIGSRVSALVTGPPLAPCVNSFPQSVWTSFPCGVGKINKGGLIHLLLSGGTSLGLGEEILKVLLGVGLAGSSLSVFLFWWHSKGREGRVRRGDEVGYSVHQRFETGSTERSGWSDGGGWLGRMVAGCRQAV